MMTVLNVRLQVDSGAHAVKSISMLDFRANAESVIARIQKGERLILTRRGKPVARLEPVLETTFGPDDPFYSLGELAVDGEGVSNAEIDEILYGQ